MMKKTIAIIALCSAAVLTGCANIKEGAQSLVSPAAKKVAEISSGLSPAQAAAARAAYYEETERVLVGWSPGDEGYEDAVKKYITEPAEFQSGYIQSILTGNYDSIIRLLTERGDRITVDGDKCIVLSTGWKSCPPVD